LVRVVVIFTALAARVLTHAGVNKNTLATVHMFTKEFLLSVRELDLRVRYELLSAMSGSKLKDHWWLKSHYISLLNLTCAVEALGPLKNFWDGGGKGKRYTQKVKPHVPLGICDGGNFMMRLIQSVYNEFIMDYLDGLIVKQGNGYHNLKNSKEQGSNDNGTTITDSNFADDGSANESEPSPVATNGSNDNDDGGASTGSTGINSTANSNAGERDDRLDYSPMEDDEMKKARIIYIYQNKNELQQSINRHEPIAGIVM